MSQEFHEVENALKRLEKIQAEHIESFQIQLLPDLEAQTAKRREAFDNLICCLEKFFTRTGQDDEEQTASMVLIFKKQLKGLQRQNLTLKEKVEAYREDLRARMKHLAKGRKVIDSYRPPSSFSNRPRAISLTN
ncbi:hypothetical protein [Desulfospira joergensenii]|uniref:hypothetical protein n=1 Tax=Desulfospira joergensenii TaxID=53329 RepID=UPI0003B50192|nr:hypothetical protein [Desulfospira joergensenii]